jgi:hypothetical protein
MKLNNILRYSEIFYKKALWSYFLVKSGAVNPLLKFAQDPQAQKIISDLNSAANLYIRKNSDLWEELSVIKNMFDYIAKKNEQNPNYGGYTYLNNLIRATYSNYEDEFEDEDEDEDEGQPLSAGAQLSKSINELQSYLRSKANSLGKNLKSPESPQTEAELRGQKAVIDNKVKEDSETVEEEEAERLEEQAQERIMSGEQQVLGGKKLYDLYTNQLEKYKNIKDLHREDPIFVSKIDKLIALTETLKGLANSNSALVDSLTDLDKTIKERKEKLKLLSPDSAIYAAENNSLKTNIKEKEENEEKLKSINDQLAAKRAAKKGLWNTDIKPVLRTDEIENFDQQLKDSNLGKLREKILKEKKKLNLSLNSRDLNREAVNDKRKELINKLVEFEKRKDKDYNSDINYPLVQAAIKPLEEEIEELSRAVVSITEIGRQQAAEHAQIRAGEKGLFKAIVLRLKQNTANIKMGVKKEFFDAIKADVQSQVRRDPDCETQLKLIEKVMEKIIPLRQKIKNKSISVSERLELKELEDKQLEPLEDRLRKIIELKFQDVLASFFAKAQIPGYYESELSKFAKHLKNKEDMAENILQGVLPESPETKQVFKAEIESDLVKATDLLNRVPRLSSGAPRSTGPLLENLISLLTQVKERL